VLRRGGVEADFSGNHHLHVSTHNAYSSPNPLLADVLGVLKHGLRWPSARNIFTSQDRLLDKWSHRREVAGRAYSDV
jgi:hypothetical protein